MTIRRLAHVLLGLSIGMILVGAAGLSIVPMHNASPALPWVKPYKFDANGDVPVPGSANLHLPAGKVAVSFRAQLPSGPDNHLPLPKLDLDIDPPPGVAQPLATADYGVELSSNNDAHHRVWFVQVPTDGVYKITTDGEVNGIVTPSLAFGMEDEYPARATWPMWPFIALLVVGSFALLGSRMWSAFAPPPPNAAANRVFLPYSPEQYLGPQTPTDDGDSAERLKTLASLRDSGAITEAEFETEKRRILDDL